MRTALLMIFALLVLGCSTSVDEGAMSYSPASPELDQALTVSFHPEHSVSALVESENVQLRFTLLAGDGSLHSQAIPMEKHGTSWQASFTPSDLIDDPAVLVFAFVDGEDLELFDNNQGKSWKILLNKDGVVAPGANFQNFRLLAGQERLADVLSFPRERDGAKEFVDLELEVHPENFRAQREKWLMILDEYGDEAPDSLTRHIDVELGKRLAGWQDWEELPSEIVDLLDLYWQIDRQEAMENVRDAMLGHFQGSDAAREIMHYKAMHEANMEIRVEQLQNLHRIFPEWEGANDDRGFIIYWALGAMNNAAKANEVVDSGLPVEPGFANYLAQRFMGLADDERASALLEQSLTLLIEAEWSPEGSMSEAEWTRDNSEATAAAHFALAQLRIKDGLGRDALPHLTRIADDFPEFADAEVYRELIGIQTRMEQPEEVRANYEKLAGLAELSPVELAGWKDVYEGEQPFVAHMAQVRQESRDEAWNGYEKHALNWDAPGAIFTDLDGISLGLEELSGKVVLLDFWATWCGPCKMALPGIDKMVPEFVDGGDFVVIPANTWERVSGDERKAAAQATWTELGLSLPIYFDKTRDEGRPAVEAFGVSGIPTSFLIGKDGKILFKTIGYGGEAGELELKSKIEWALSK